MGPDDESRFTAFVAANSASLFRTAFLMTGDYQRAEDLLQNTLVRVYQRWSRIEAMERPVAYSRRVLVNQCTSWWRRRSAHELPALVHETGAWDGHLDQVAEHERVWSAVLALPPRQRAVMVLKYYEDLSEADIAATLDMAPGTVKSHTHAACRRLAVLLAEAPSEPADSFTVPAAPPREVTP